MDAEVVLGSMRDRRIFRQSPPTTMLSLRSLAYKRPSSQELVVIGPEVKEGHIQL
jgi:hypothetical protein